MARKVFHTCQCICEVHSTKHCSAFECSVVILHFSFWGFVMSVLLFFYTSLSIIIVVMIWFGDLFVTQIMYLKHFAWHMSELDHLHWENFQTWKKSHFISGCLRCGICHCLWIVILAAGLSLIESACCLIPACRIRNLWHRKVDLMSILRTAVNKINSKQDLSHCFVHCWCYVCTIQKDCSCVDPGWNMCRNSLVV